MEPVAYIMGFSYATLGWGVWTLSRIDINDYSGVYLNSVNSKSLAFYRKHNFDIENFFRLEEEIRSTKESLASFGVYCYSDNKYILSPAPIEIRSEEKPSVVLN